MDSSANTTNKKAASKATPTAAQSKSAERPYTKTERLIVSILHGLVLVLSVLLIVFISYDTFEGIPFLENKHYMTFQLWVCIVFLVDFFVEMIISHDHWDYVKGH